MVEASEPRVHVDAGRPELLDEPVVEHRLGLVRLELGPDVLERRDVAPHEMDHVPAGLRLDRPRDLARLQGHGGRHEVRVELRLELGQGDRPPEAAALRGRTRIDRLLLGRLGERRGRDLGGDPFRVRLVGNQDVLHLHGGELRQVRLVGVAERRLVHPVLRHGLLHLVHQEQPSGERLDLRPGDPGVGQLRLERVGAAETVLELGEGVRDGGGIDLHVVLARVGLRELLADVVREREPRARRLLGLVPDRRAARGAGELGEEAEQRDVRVQLVDRDLAGLPHGGRRRRIVRAGGEQHHDTQGREHAKETRDGDHGSIVATDSVSPMARSRPPSTSAGSSEPGTRPGSRFRVAVVRR